MAASISIRSRQGGATSRRMTAEQRAHESLSREDAEAAVGQYGGLVRSLARRYALNRSMRDDLAQEGFRALLVAAARTKTPFGSKKFTSYAATRIRGAMVDFVEDWRYQVRLPANRSRHQLEMISLDWPADSQEESHPREFLFAECGGAELSLDLTEAIAKLAPREAEVVRRCGANGETRASVAKDLKCSASNVSLIWLGALRKLRQHFE